MSSELARPIELTPEEAEQLVAAARQAGAAFREFAHVLADVLEPILRQTNEELERLRRELERGDGGRIP